MADRIASVSRFRAEGVQLSWAGMARGLVAHAGRWGGAVDERLLQSASKRGTEIALRWAPSKVLGSPPAAFTVWIRGAQQARADREVEVSWHPLGLGQVLRWQGEASVVQVGGTVGDGQRPVVLMGFRGAISPATVVAAETTTGDDGDPFDLELRGSAMTCALLVNASDARGFVDHLRDVVTADDWEPWELVGLPVGYAADGSDVGLPGYDDSKQGLFSAMAPPADAARQRLDRGAPIFGWAPLTETGQGAPPWEPSAVDDILAAARAFLPEVTDLFTVRCPEQAGLRPERPIDPPEQDGRTIGETSTATLPTLGALLLPATTDPYYALALGFGTSYPMYGDQERLSEVDFLVTADYPDTPEGGPATYAAYVPRPVPHSATAPVTGLAAGRDGLIRPFQPDQPWRETIRVGWDAVDSTVALGRPTGFSVLRFDPSSAEIATCLLDHRTTDLDWLPRVPARASAPPGGPPSSRNVAVDPQQEIPLGSGGHTVGYAVAVEDVFGIWSTWEDTVAVTDEPGPPLPRIMSARLDAKYTGSTSCLAALEVELALDWSDRTISAVELSAALFPAVSSAQDPPGGLDPSSPDVLATLTFTGDEPSGLDVVCLDSSGTTEVPAGPAQSQEGRRYRVTVPLGSIDYSATRYWGVALWARSTLSVLGSGPWAPGSPVVAYAASPVPPAMPLPPPLPGVPVGSTPDGRGCSHVRVVWADPVGPVDHFAVYELAETALRSVLPVGALPALPPTAPAGARLVQLRTAYDTMLTPVQRRSIFRRVLQPAADQRSADLTLPRGSTDIHLFAVVGVAPSSVESPWPQTSDGLQPFRAPTVVSPAPPALRSSFDTSGPAVALKLEVETASSVPVQSFRLHRTTSPEASRSAGTMGPAFAEVPAADSGDAPSPTGTRRYTGSWQGVPATGWRSSYYRAVAVPVPAVPTEGVVGAPSEGSPALTLDVPPAGPPVLEDLVSATWDDTGVTVLTATTAPLFTPPAGSFVLRATASVAGAPLFAELSTTLDALAQVDGSSGPGAPAPAGGDPGPRWVREARSAGRTPLSLWFRRGGAGDPVDVTIRLADPLGRVTTRTLAVPAAPLTPPPTLEIIDAFVITGRGIAVTFRSDAPPTVTADGAALLRINARRRTLLPFPPRPPFQPRLPFPPFPPRPPFPPPGQEVSLEIALPDVPRAGVPPPAGQPVVVGRTSDASPYDYSALIRLTAPAWITVAVVNPDGATATDSRLVE